jgi:hypothetical protein
MSGVMRMTQPPIMRDQELAGCQVGAEQLRQMIERHETDLMAERQHQSADIIAPRSHSTFLARSVSYRGHHAVPDERAGGSHANP